MKDRLLDRVIRFDVLLGIVAILIALVAAFFSVYGIATLFAGAFLSTTVMGTVLEIGKLVAVTYLYRYWKQTKTWLSAYLTIALIILMVITSGGIFGYLSSAYQKSSTAYKAQQNQIVLVEKTKVYSQQRIDQAQARIAMLAEMRKTQEGRLSETLTNSLIARNAITLKQLQDQTTEMIKSNETETKAEQDKIDAAIKEIQDTDKKVSEMKFGENNKDIRTFEFVAKLFNTDLDTVAKWFIFLLIVVFDPLAIALILAYNVVTYKKSESTNAKKQENVEIVDLPAIVEHKEYEEDKKKVGKAKSISLPIQKLPRPIPVEKPPEPPPPPQVVTIPPDDFMRGYFKAY